MRKATGRVTAAREEGDVSLEMRDSCERCRAPLSGDGVAYICSYECTFCQGCVEALEAVCPNCGGELLRRPRRVPERVAP